jgi:membrane protease YdiL (CAAX protease family)
VQSWRAESPRLGREVALLFGSCLACSIVLVIATRVDMDRPEYDLAAGLGQLLLALVFALRNAASVAAALRPPLAGCGLSVLAAGALGFPVVGAGLWLLSLLGFQFLSYLESYRHHDWPLWPAFLVTAVLAPVAEEVMFRGVIQQALERLLRPTEALVVQAALFSALHLSPAILLTHFAMGLLFGWVFRQSRSLYPGMALHALWNFLVLCLELAG